ncbi:MAG: hypothetical protein ACKVU1_15360 [bacterium]
MGNFPQWGGAFIPSMWLPGSNRFPTAVLPCASRLVATDWWASAGIAPYYPQPLPATLARPAYLALGAMPLPPHGRHRRISAASNLADFLED